MTYEGDGGYTDGYIDGYTAVTSQWMTRETAGSNALRHLTKIDDVFDEPDWIADLLEDFDAGSDWIAIRHFVEHSVRLCASLKLQLETVQRCVVCNDADGSRGTVSQPCAHAQLC